MQKKVSGIRGVLLYAALVILAVMSVCAFAACDSGGSDAKFTATVSDLYIRQGDSSFDFEKNLPEGVTIDASAVKIDTVGVYTVTYRQGEATQEKSAYVFGIPEMTRDGAALADSYDLSYKQAREMDFMDAAQFGIAAEDSFGDSLTIAVSMDKAFLGEYGEYEVQYSASDLAGNTVTETVVYTVSGETPPAISFNGADVADDTVTVNAALSAEEQNSLFLYVDDVYVDMENYTKSDAEIVIDASVFHKALYNPEKRTFRLKLDTDEWYSVVELTFTDAKPLEYDAPSFDGRSYRQTETLELPVPERLKPQDFHFEYEVSGPAGALTVTPSDNGTVVIANEAGGLLAQGDYTFTVKGMRGDAETRKDEAAFRVLSDAAYKDEYIKYVAALDSADSSDGLRAKDDTVVSFSYDDAMGAYKVEPLVHRNDGTNSIMVDSTSEAYTKIAEGCDMFTYLAFDMYFTAPGTQNGIRYYMATEAGDPNFHGYWFTTELTYTRTDNNLKVGNYLDLQANTWYTIYIQTGGLVWEVPGGYDFFAQNMEADVETNSTYYVKNIRFEDAIPEFVESKEVGNNYVYEVNGVDLYSLPESLGGNCTLQGPTGEIDLGAGNTFLIADAGEYTATGDGGTIKFTVYEPEDFKKIVAPLVSDQHEYAIAAGNAEFATFAFDPDMGAYKYTPLKKNEDDTNSVIVPIGTDVYNKLNAGCGEYTYLAMDMYFTADEAGHLMWWVSTADGSTYHGYWFSQVIYVETETGVQATDYLSVTGGKWYTVYLQAGGLDTQYTSVSYRLFSQRSDEEGNHSPLWVKNIRFTDEIEKGDYAVVQDNWIYRTDDSASYILPQTLGGDYTFTGPSGEVQKSVFTMSELAAGEYTAAGNGQTVRFKVVTPAEYASIIAPLDSESAQFAGIGSWDSNFTTFAYDAEMGAYKLSQVPGTKFDNVTTGQAPTGLRISAGSAAHNQLAAGVGANKFIAFDIYFEGTAGTLSTTKPYISFVNSLLPYQWYYTTELMIAKTGEVPSNETRANGDPWKVEQGAWYTVYVRAADLTAELFMYTDFTADGTMNNYWIKNIRFVDQADTGLSAYGLE